MITSTSTSRSLRSDITFAFALALACYVAWLARRVLFLLYVSALFAVVLQPLVQFIARLRIGRFYPFRRVAILILLAAVIGGLVRIAVSFAADSNAGDVDFFIERFAVGQSKSPGHPEANPG